VRHAGQVLFSGMGSSLFACVRRAMLNAKGRACAAVDASELLYYYRALGKDTLAILVSRSGETIEVVKALTLLRSNGVRIVGVTNVAGSTLAKESDITIHVTAAGSPDRFADLYRTARRCLRWLHT